MARGKGELQVRPRCWFCGREGTSLEHIFARSLTELFGRDPDAEGMIRHDQIYREDGFRKTKRAKTFANTTRRFCRDCNSGWMNDLDDHARPFLRAFATGTPITLDRAAQELLARWAHKIALGFISQERDGFVFASRSDFTDFFQTRRPPLGSQIWIGSNDHGEMGNFGSWSLTVYDAPAADTDAYGYGVSFGHAGFVGMVHRATEFRYRLKWEAHQMLKEVHPSSARPLRWRSGVPIPGRDFAPLVNLMASPPNGFDTNKQTGTA